MYRLYVYEATTSREPVESNLVLLSIIVHGNTKLPPQEPGTYTELQLNQSTGVYIANKKQIMSGSSSWVGAYLIHAAQT